MKTLIIALTLAATISAHAAPTKTSCKQQTGEPSAAEWEILIKSAIEVNANSGYDKVVSVTTTQTNLLATACVVSE